MGVVVDSTWGFLGRLLCGLWGADFPKVAFRISGTTLAGYISLLVLPGYTGLEEGWRSLEIHRQIS